jgi:hypothetical protein
MNAYNGPVLTSLLPSKTRFNTVWGAEYFLMNEPSFIGNRENKNYDKIIHIMVNIRSQAFALAGI